MTTSGESLVESDSAVLPIPSIVLSSVTGVVALCSLSGNLFVFLTIWRSKTLQRLNNALVLSLAAADLVRSLTVMVLYGALALVRVSPTDQRWLCPFYTSLVVLCENAVILNIVFIAIERVFLITRPLVYQRTITATKVSVTIASLWVFSLVFGGLQTLRFLNDHDQQQPVAFSSAVCFPTPSLGYAVADVIVTLVLPVVTLFVCYGKIFSVVHSQMRRIVPKISDTYANSEGTFSYAEVLRPTYSTRCATPSFWDRESALQHGVGEHSRSSNVFTVAVAPEGGIDPLATRPLSNIEEDRVESRGQSSNDGDHKEIEKPAVQGSNHSSQAIRILVTQPSRESLPVGSTADERQRTSGSDLPGIVPTEIEPILSPIILSRRNTPVPRSISAPETGQSVQSRPIASRRGSSVTFNLGKDSDARNQTTRRGSVQHAGSLPPAANRKGSFSQRSSRGDSLTSGSSSVNPQGPHRRNSAVKINDNKAFKMTAIVVGAFIVCWVPAKICFLLRVISGSLISDLTFDVVMCLTFVGSALDPYIYNFYSAEFRRALKRVLTCSADQPDMPWM